MKLHNAYTEKMDAQMKEWGAQVQLLEAKMDNVSADLKVRRMEELHALRAQQHAAAEKMRELGKASGAAWEDMKNTADKLWDDLKSGLADAQSKFK